MTKLFFWLFLLVFSFPLLAQDTQSSLTWYKTFFGPAADRRTGNDLLSVADDARSMNDLQLEAFSRKEAGMLFLTRMHDYEKAMDCFIRALTIEDSLKLTQEKIFTYLAISEVFAGLGNSFKSLEMLRHALELNHAGQDKEILVFIMLKEGSLNSALGRFQEAFENYEHVIRSEAEIGAPSVKAEAFYQLGLLLAAQGKFEDAMAKQKSALAIRRAVKDRRNEAVSLSAIGELYAEMQNHEKALANHVVALEIWNELKDAAGIATSYNNAGVLYYHQKNFQRAIANLELGLAAGHEAQSHQQIRKSYEFLSQCYKELRDYQKSLEYKELYIAITDLIQNEKNQHEVVELQNQYMMDQKELQIDKLEAIRLRKEKELAQEKRIRNFLYALSGLGVVIAAMILYLYLMKRRSNRILKVAHRTVQIQNTELEELNATKDKFFSIISHDLKGPLNSLTSFSSLLINHTDSLTKDEIRMLAKDLDKSLKNLFNLLENLLEWSRSQTGNIEFKPESFDMVAVVKQNQELLAVQAQNKQITLEVQTEELPITVAAHKNSVNTVIRNLMSNAIKFTPPGGYVKVRVTRQDHVVTVAVSDNGVGMPPEVVGKLFRLDTKLTTKGTADEKGTGLGLILCKDFIEKNGGTIAVQSEVSKGSTFSFSLPLAEVESKLESVVIR
ncbi:MAG TPA: tetratricopeptide repeat-containing sensor histidine kinase [Chryseosolibacter sp.]|nr:tetratricopeptide repeat-containing sensor histidine kinase [Chryseosolibacter sp.]